MFFVGFLFLEQFSICVSLFNTHVHLYIVLCDIHKKYSIRMLSEILFVHIRLDLIRILIHVF